MFARISAWFEGFHDEGASDGLLEVGRTYSRQRLNESYDAAVNFGEFVKRLRETKFKHMLP